MRWERWTVALLVSLLLAGCSWDGGVGGVDEVSDSSLPRLVLHAAVLDLMGFERSAFRSGAPFRIRAALRNEGGAPTRMLSTGRILDACILVGDSLVIHAAEGCVDSSRAEFLTLEPGDELELNWLAPGGWCEETERILPAGAYTARILLRVDPPYRHETGSLDLDFQIVD